MRGLRIAVLGTRGIPNRYGGFEQCAEKLALLWVEAGHEVTVYCPAEHPLKDASWRGVRRRLVPSGERHLGPFGTLLYDALCLRDALRGRFDVLLNLGYVPAAAFFPRPERAVAPLVTNMDGLEWKRAKWGPVARRFARWCEARAASRSHHLVADNPGIEEYLRSTYPFARTTYIPYGAEIPREVSEGPLRALGLRPGGYFLTVARLEPENNLSTILEGYLKARVPEPFVVVGGLETRHGRRLRRRFGESPGIRFLGAVYDRPLLDSLRRFSKIYFHGHSVGGTNPSLLEAMAAGAFIAAHENPFNRHVLGEDALYFGSPEDVAGILTGNHEARRRAFVSRNLEKIRRFYRWEAISRAYLRLFGTLCG